MRGIQKLNSKARNVREPNDGHRAGLQADIEANPADGEEWELDKQQGWPGES